MTYLMFIHDLDVSDNIHAKESAMLGLTYESVFSEEVKIGEKVGGYSRIEEWFCG